MKTIIVIPEVVPGLNGNQGLIREHFRAAKIRKDRYLEICLSQKKGSYKGRVKIHFIRYTIKLMDWDNMAASFKHIGDSLVAANIITDDKPSIINPFLPDQIKVSKRVDQKSVVIIEDFDNIEIKEEIIKLDQGTTITDPKKFYRSHCAYINGNRGNKRYKPYYDRLVQFYNYYESRH